MVTQKKDEQLKKLALNCKENIYENRKIEELSEININLMEQIKWLMTHYQIGRTTKNSLQQVISKN